MNTWTRAHLCWLLCHSTEGGRRLTPLWTSWKEKEDSPHSRTLFTQCLPALELLGMGELLIPPSLGDSKKEKEKEGRRGVSLKEPGS